MDLLVINVKTGGPIPDALRAVLAEQRCES